MADTKARVPRWSSTRKSKREFFGIPAKKRTEEVLAPLGEPGHLEEICTDYVVVTSTKHTETKIHEIKGKLKDGGIASFTESDIAFVLGSTYANGDDGRAIELFQLISDSEEGVIRPYTPDVRLVGAVNRNKSTCYLDATLFAMFSQLDTFEAMLYHNFDDPPRRRLSIWVRIWVNCLRSGKLITPEITKQLQESMATCGWLEAARDEQQDASELFSFLSSRLEMPMLTLKQDIFHRGNDDKDDHKYVHERLLEVSIPDDRADGSPIPLEDCLETYFNNRIEVKRYMSDLLQRRNTLGSIIGRKPSVDSISKAKAQHVEIAALDPPTPTTPKAGQELPSYCDVRPALDTTRRPSIFTHHYPDEKSEARRRDSTNRRGSLHSPPGRNRAFSMTKEVNMPAWQFYNLIPWYTDGQPDTNKEVAQHFAHKRPMLGVCLKRYCVDKQGNATRRSTKIDISAENSMPHFVVDDDEREDGTSFANFKLVLQSVVCHRGNSVNSGHYISIVRSQVPRTGSSDGATASNTWMMFDDLASERVRYVDINEALKTESPYLLFYQITPADDYPDDSGRPSYDGLPPSYTVSSSETPSVDSLQPAYPSISSTPPSLMPAVEAGRRGSIKSESYMTMREPEVEVGRRSSIQTSSPSENSAVTTATTVTHFPPHLAPTPIDAHTLTSSSTITTPRQPTFTSSSRPTSPVRVGSTASHVSSANSRSRSRPRSQGRGALVRFASKLTNKTSENPTTSPFSNQAPNLDTSNPDASSPLLVSTAPAPLKIISGVPRTFVQEASSITPGLSTAPLQGTMQMHMQPPASPELTAAPRRRISRGGRSDTSQQKRHSIAGLSDLIGSDGRGAMSSIFGDRESRASQGKGGDGKEARGNSHGRHSLHQSRREKSQAEKEVKRAKSMQPGERKGGKEDRECVLM